MKKIKRTLALALALVLALSCFAVTAYALPVAKPNSSITVKVGESYEAFAGSIPQLVVNCPHCGADLITMTPEDRSEYRNVSVQSSNAGVVSNLGYGFANTKIVGDDYDYEALTFHFDGAQAGTTTITVSYSIYFYHQAVSGSCGSCGGGVRWGGINQTYNFERKFNITVEGETTYTVTYTDGVEGETVFPDQGYEGLKAGDKTPAFEGTPTREGYTFMGWAPAVAEYVTEDVTYVATWKKNPTIYTVTYTDGVEGETVFPDQGYEVEAGSKTPAFVGTPSREGYTFMGWAPAVAEYVTEDITYVATWKKNPTIYTVTYTDGVEGEVVFPDQGYEVEAGSKTPAFVGTPSREGYTFMGWAPAVAEYVTENVTYVATWEKSVKYLHIVDGMTGEEIAVYNDEQVAAMDITTLAYDLKVDAKTEGDVAYLFAGWFTAPQTANDWDHDSWASKSVAGKTLAADDSTIYAWYIKADYTNLTIAYTSNGTKATRTFMLSTVPGDIFNTYAHVMSTAASANDETLFKGAVIDGLKANAIEKKTVYTNIAIAPFSAQSPKTANDFNKGLGGIYQNGTNGYISYTLINNIPVGKTLFVRPYYVTMEGTTIYGSTAHATIAAYANVTGLEG